MHLNARVKRALKRSVGTVARFWQPPRVVPIPETPGGAKRRRKGVFKANGRPSGPLYRRQLLQLSPIKGGFKANGTPSGPLVGMLFSSSMITFWVVGPAFGERLERFF